VRLALVLSALGVPGFALLVAQSLPPPYDTFVTYGPLGVFTLLYILGQIVSKRELERAEARAVKAEAQRDALAERAMTDVLPLVVRVSDTMVPALDRMATAVERMTERMDRLERER
jgi:hypothetical protein